MKEFEEFDNDLRSIKSRKNKEEILKLSRTPNLTFQEMDQLDFLILEESKSILKEKGQTFIVHSRKTDIQEMKRGQCYGNSTNMMLNENYDYVEGYVTHKKKGYKNCHAWNVDRNGNHWDFTLNNSEDYEYFGVKIPSKTVLQVCMRNDRVSFCVLPFIDDPTTLTMK